MTEKDLRNLPPLSLPIANLRIAREADGTLRVFDPLRKKFIILTPEEWVRQNFVDWLQKHRNYPASMIANEVELNLNDTRKRCDSVVFGRDCQPLVIIEYKAPDINISQSTFDQLVRYNMKLKAKYLIVSNGRNHYCCVIDYANNSYNFIPVIPEYNQAVGMPGEN